MPLLTIVPPMPGAERRFKPFVDFVRTVGWETEFVRLEFAGRVPPFGSTEIFPQVDAQTADKVVMGFSLGALYSHLGALRARHLILGSISPFFLEDDETTYVVTGDIPAMWLRDSSAQTIPYIRYQAVYPVLRARFAGVIERNARNVLTDIYANALDANYHVWERKWEVDSPAWFVVLASIYWRVTHDPTVFTTDLHRALQARF